MVSTTARRAAVEWLRETRKTSLRRACRVVGLSTASWRYRPRVSAANEKLIRQLHEHAAARSRFGYRRLHVLIAREGTSVNHKRVYRLYREAGLQVRRRRRKRRTRGERVPLPAPTQRGERWSMDLHSTRWRMVGRFGRSTSSTTTRASAWRSKWIDRCPACG